MKKVLEHAEQLAGSILDSKEFISMRLAEQAATRDEEATRLIADFIEKRQRVENLLSDNNLDQGELASAGDEMEAAQKKMNDHPMIQAMQSARTEFTNMMNQVNALIRFVVTGESQQPQSGCSGSCDSCSGCEH
jgi:cell fate (sporulation/competence/biofilm development) regulator YlbF (YheA/YmcA/DUF963 family)